MKSLRSRAVAAGIVWATLSILIGVFGLSRFLDSQTMQRFDEQLRNRHTQVVVVLANNYEYPDTIMSDIDDPVYLQPFSGEYWQIEDERGEIYVSASLVDQLLPTPREVEGEATFANIMGPRGEVLRGISEWFTLDDGSTWRVHVASSTKGLIEDRVALRNNLILAFAVIAIIGIIGAFLQASATLKPLNALRRDVLSRWESEDGLEPASYPTEVAPLVNDINSLLDRNRDIVSRSRRQAADLAHAIKTPSAIVRNELEKLSAQGQPVQDSIDALDRLDAQLKRSLARMRAGDGEAAMPTATDLDTALGRLTRAFTALARNSDRALAADVQPGLRARIDQTDFEEVIGNLIDNAVKWSKAQIDVSARRVGDKIRIVIADDGPGIPDGELANVTEGGRRLDTSKPGTGLGLAIASDLAHAYGGEVTLGHSATLGGLQVTVTLQQSRGKRAAT